MKSRSSLRRLRSYRTRLALAGAASLIALPVFGTASSAASTAHSATAKSSNAPDFAYFKGKSINWYDYGAAGSTPDVQIRTLAPYVAAYLHASVNVVDAASTESLITGQNVPAGQPANGLTIGTLDTLADVGDFVNNVPGLEFSLRSVSVLASLPQATQYVMSYVGSGPTSFKQMVDSTTPVTALALQNGSVTLLEQLLYGAYKIPIKYVYGYSTGSALSQGFARGDGMTCAFTLTAFATLVPAGKITLLLQTAKATKGEVDYSYAKPVPTVAQFAATDPPKSSDGKKELQTFEELQSLGSIYFEPPGTPQKYVSALNAALTFALTRKGVDTQLTNEGLTPGLFPAAKAKASIFGAIKEQAELSRWLAAAAAE